MDVQQEVEQVEKELLILITTHLQNNQMTQDEAQRLAQDFLKFLPVKDQADLLKKLQDLATNYDKVKPLYFTEKNKIFEQNKDQILTHVSTLIKSGNIDQAISTIKHHTQGETL